MKNKKTLQKAPKGNVRTVLNRFWALPFSFALGLVSLLSIVLIGIVLSLPVLTYVGLGITLACLVFFLVYLTYALRKVEREANDSLQEMSRQLDSFSHGDLKYLSARHSSPALDDFQGVINRTISSYSSLRFVYKESELDQATDLKIASGAVLTFPQFVGALPHEIERNLNFRSALAFVQSLGQGAGDPATLRDLHDAIIAAFPSSLVALYDDTTFALYIPDVSSFRSLRERLERLVGSYKSFRATKGTNITALSYCKAGASVYPYVPITSLVDDGLQELKRSEGVSLTSDVSKVYYPHAILTEDNKRIVYFATVENFEALYGRSETYGEAVQALRKYGGWLASQIGFSAAGFLAYYDETKTYELIYETHREAASASFSKLGNRIEASRIDPFYEEALKDVFFSSSDLSDLPSSLSAPLQNLGVESFYFSSVLSEGGKRGFIYFTGTDKREPFSLLERELLSRYASLASSFIVSLQERSKAEESLAIVEALSDRSGKYVYSLDKASHRLTYLSKNLQRSFPDAKIGDLCYEALRGEKAPCAHCPLSHGVEHRIIERISSTECAISVLLYKGALRGQSTILIEDTGRENVKSSNRFLDQSLLIRNREALSLDLSRQLKQHDAGYVLTLRLLNGNELIKKAVGSTSNSIMAMVTKSIRDAGYGDIVYRLGEFDILFMLKSYQKSKIMGFAEEISEIIHGPFDYELVKLEPSYAYCSVCYPLEAATAREITSLVESELLRSASFGPGYLTQVADNHPRLAFREDYVDDLLTKTLSRPVMPIAVQPIYQPLTKRILSADILARLYTAEGDQIPSGELFAAAGRRQMVDRIDFGALGSAGKLAEDYAEPLSKSNVQSLCVRLSGAALQDSAFVDKVKGFYEQYSLPKRYLHFVVELPLFLSNKQELEKLMAAVASYGVVWEVAGVNEDNVSLEKLTALGIRDLRTELSFISRATNNPNDYQTCSRFVYTAIRAGFSLMCCGIETQEEKDVAEHLEMPLLQGYFLSEPLKANDFAQLLAFTK